MLKNLFLILLFFFQINALEESKSEIEPLDGNNQEQVEDKFKLITLIGKEGNKYQVPKDIALQSKMIEVAYTKNEDQEIPTQIESENLEFLLDILKVIQQTKNRMLTKELHEFIWGKSFKNFDVSEDEDWQTLKSLFYDAIKLDCEALTNVISDFCAMLIKMNIELLYKVMEIVKPEHLHFVDKFYYLRFQQVLDFGNKRFNELIEDRMQISVDDLLGFSNKISVYKTITKFGQNVSFLDLSHRRLTSLNGIEKIKHIEQVIMLILNHNKVVKKHRLRIIEIDTIDFQNYFVFFPNLAFLVIDSSDANALSVKDMQCCPKEIIESQQKMLKICYGFKPKK